VLFNSFTLETLRLVNPAAQWFTDPPYNVPVPGHVSGKGRYRHNDFAMACGEMSGQAYIAFLSIMMKHMAAYSVDGALHYVFMDWRHIGELVAAGEQSGVALKNICVWVKDNGGMGSLYRSRHEFICVFKVGSAVHINNVELGRFGRNRTNVWEYPGMNSLGAEDRDQLANHPTPKPVTMIADAILDSTRRGDIVLDPFLGSGTTVIAAEKTGRRCFALELDPGYIDAAIRRWQAWTGADAVHAGSGATFNEMSNVFTSSNGNGAPNKEDHEHGR
jgi:DNA modification methylase